MMEKEDLVIGKGPFNRIPQFGFSILDDRKRFFKTQIQAIESAIRKIQENIPHVEIEERFLGIDWSVIDPRSLFPRTKQEGLKVDINKIYRDMFSKNGSEAFQEMLDAIHSIRCLKDKKDLEKEIFAHILYSMREQLSTYKGALNEKVIECKKLGKNGKKYLETISKVLNNIHHINEIFLMEWIDEQDMYEVWSKVTIYYSTAGMDKG